MSCSSSLAPSIQQLPCRHRNKNSPTHHYCKELVLLTILVTLSFHMLQPSPKHLFNTLLVQCNNGISISITITSHLGLSLCYHCHWRGAEERCALLLHRDVSHQRQSFVVGLFVRQALSRRCSWRRSSGRGRGRGRRRRRRRRRR